MKKYGLFLFWFVSLSIPATYMMGTHSLSLNSSKSNQLKSLATSQTTWTKLHFLGADCGCSEDVFNSLKGRKPAMDIKEKIYVIGKNDLWVTTLRNQGFDVVSAEMDTFTKDYSINAVPQLTIIDDKKNILYSGGYTNKRGPASSIEDVQITKELKEKNHSPERPIFGCITGSINRMKSDPLKIKY